MTPDLFPGTKPPRAKPRVLMHVSDACESEGQPRCVMACRRCGAETGWLLFDTVTEAKRGIPCESCNASAPTRMETTHAN
jgi:DNA-directed RNA polymerase subunit RPC12/RpoP